jgi:hypothetical protein
MSSDDETHLSDLSGSDHELPSSNLVATPDVGEIAEGEYEEDFLKSDRF